MGTRGKGQRLESGILRENAGRLQIWLVDKRNSEFGELWGRGSREWLSPRGDVGTSTPSGQSPENQVFAFSRFHFSALTVGLFFFS